MKYQFWTSHLQLERASLGIREEIENRYAVGSYILADLCFDIYYDKKRECVFDDEGNLLQVKFETKVL